MRRALPYLLLLVAALVLSACAPDVRADDEPGEAPSDGDADTAREDAEALLGTAEADLPEDVRVSRRGDEGFMLTEDYVIGRMTAELEADDAGVYRVVLVTLELPDGPETFGDR